MLLFLFVSEIKHLILSYLINSSVLFAAYFKYAILNRYDPVCRIVNYYVCGSYTEFCLFILIDLVNNYKLSNFKGKLGDTHNFISC